MNGGFVVVPKTPLAKPDCLAPFAIPSLAEATGLHATKGDLAHRIVTPCGSLPLYLVHQLLLL